MGSAACGTICSEDCRGPSGSKFNLIICADSIAVSSHKRDFHYWVRMDRTWGEQMGLDIDMDALDNSVLPVLAVRGGLATKWNLNHHGEACCIEPGDDIVEVNGILGNLDAILEACMQESMLTVCLRRKSQTHLESLMANSFGPLSPPSAAVATSDEFMAGLHEWRTGGFHLSCETDDVELRAIPGDGL
mmetsp:Transcript_99709/g.267721  ORF Transcript_99709/g.267721 Transcript_99709/m.267721 type:complete len:189 (+) Transcript_99709:46-612(+)